MKRYFLSLLFLIASVTQAAACGWLGFETAEPKFILVSLQDLLPGYSDKWMPSEWDDHDMIVSEWRQHLKIPKNDKAEWLETVLYGPEWSYDRDVREANNQKWIIITKGSIKDPEDLAYLLPVVERSIKLQDMWGERPELTEGQYLSWRQQALATGQSPFLKRRYAYQAIKAANRLGHHGEAVGLFDGVFAQDKTRDSVYFRSWSLYCSSLIEAGDNKRAVVECMNMYMDNPEQRYGIRSFLINKTGEKERREYVENPDMDVKKRATLAWLAGDLEKALELEPSTDRARHMLYDRVTALDRECVPKLWGRFTSGKPVVNGAGEYATEIALLKKVTAMQMERDRTPRAQVLYRTINGFLMLLEDNLAGANGQFDAAISAAGEKSAAAKQARLLKLIAYFAGTTASDAAFQERVIRDWELFGMDRDIMYSMLADRFAYNRDLVRAALCIGRTEEYAAYMDYVIDYRLGNKELDELGKIAGGAVIQPMDRAMAAGLTYTADDITYVKAMRYMKEFDYTKAHELLDSIKTPGYWPAPGKIEIKNKYDDEKWVLKGNVVYTDRGAPEKTQVLNKKELARLLMELTGPAKDDEQASANLAKAAAIYGGCSLVAYSDVIWRGGRVWCIRSHLYDYYWSFGPAFEPVSYEAQDKMVFDFSHDNLRAAANYYQKAAALTKNPELAAEYLGYAASLKAACSENTAEILSHLRTKYGGTEFYKAYSNVCTWVKYNYSQDK